MNRKQIGVGSRPLICTPLVGVNKGQIIRQLEQVLAKNPDIIEWRADFFEGIGNEKDVLDMAVTIKELAGDLPIIFTIRSIREGGNPICLTDREAIELNAEICKRTIIEYVDCELSNHPEDIKFLRDAATLYGKKVIGSYHNFQLTPCLEFLSSKLVEAEKYDMDVAKVAVMPQTQLDVLVLLQATFEAKDRLTIPLITMSMGKYGTISRMIGGVFGSSLSFAVGAQASAPGQVPIDDLKTVLDIVEKTLWEAR